MKPGILAAYILNEDLRQECNDMATLALIFESLSNEQ